MSLKSAAALALVAALAAAGAASADTPHSQIVRFTGTLTGPAGAGTVRAEVETAQKVLTYGGTVTGVTARMTGSHFHFTGGAEDKPTPPVVNDDLYPSFHGAVMLTDQQFDDLMAGKWYFDLHTAAGDLRANLTREPAPAR